MEDLGHHYSLLVRTVLRASVGVWKFSVLPVLLCAPALVIACIVIPAAGYRFMTRQTVVERLRETE